MKIKLSKSQWELIGKKTGWIRTAEENDLMATMLKMEEDYIKKITGRKLLPMKPSPFPLINEKYDWYFTSPEGSAWGKGKLLDWANIYKNKNEEGWHISFSENGNTYEQASGNISQKTYPTKEAAFEALQTISYDPNFWRKAYQIQNGLKNETRELRQQAPYSDYFLGDYN